MKSAFAILAAPLALCACASTPWGRANQAQAQAQAAYEQSVADYRSCLSANSKNTAVCDAKRASMEAQERLWSDLRCSRPGQQDAASCAKLGANVTVQNR